MNEVDVDNHFLYSRDNIVSTDGVLLESLRDAEVVSVPVALILAGESPRLEGSDPAHIERLAEIDGLLPPILLERRTLKVIDGTHRLMAAILRGSTTIQARLFDGSPADAFLYAVHANVAHGFPLSQADRRAAARRIIASHPHMSDRAIAEVAGLGAKTVAAIRRRSQDAAAQSAVRIGRDGRARPVNAAEGRRRVAEMITRYPQASLRELARHAGVSPATASDVRKRLDRGEPAAPEPGRAAEPGPGRAEPAERPASDAAEHPAEGFGQAGRAVAAPVVDPVALLEKLMRDPSLRHKDEGKRLLRLLRQNAVDARRWAELAAVVPPHCGSLVGQLAQQYAVLWTDLAGRMAGRTRPDG